jgi:hypothetical protein
MATIILERTCPKCGKISDIAVDKERYVRWVKGEHIQDVWPELSTDERELIMTGFCSDECWIEYIGPEEEDEDS